MPLLPALFRGQLVKVNLGLLTGLPPGNRRQPFPADVTLFLGPLVPGFEAVLAEAAHNLVLPPAAVDVFLSAHDAPPSNAS